MNSRAALLATAAACAFLLVSACGGGSGSDSGSRVDSDSSTGTTPPPPPTPTASGSTSGTSGSNNSGSSSSTISNPTPVPSNPTPSNNSSAWSFRCQRLTETTYIGGNLFVAEQGPIGVTLLSDGGLSPTIFDEPHAFTAGFMIMYDNVFEVPGVSNRQDRYGWAKPFPPGTRVGTSAQVQLHPALAGEMDQGAGPIPSSFPKGVPLELWLSTWVAGKDFVVSPANNSATASIGKDIPTIRYPTARVTYGANNTATVTFFPDSDGPRFSVGLTNVFGTGCARYIAVDLTASGYGDSSGLAIGDGEQAGVGTSLSGTGAPHHSHALLWRGSASSVVDLHPTVPVNGVPFDSSTVFATSGGIQVGMGQHDDNLQHALKWSGSAGSVVDLHPSGYRESRAQGISGGQIVGAGTIGGISHALLWTSLGVVTLTPSGFYGSAAYATDGVQQVGGGGIGVEYHALLWSGTAASAVDLHPAGYASSVAWGVGGGPQGSQQVGQGTVGSLRHALLWANSAQSVVDLHSDSFRETVAVSVAFTRQVGWGITADGSTHALLWQGSAGGVVDLHWLLPAGVRQSQADGIDASGNIVGTADGHAILWVPF